jgi:hypothetical protein
MDGDPAEPARPEDLDVSLKRIHGPVYLFIAFDPEQGFLEGYLYFPSMTKDRKKWHSHHFLGMSHHWLYRLMYSPDYNILLPNTNCGRRVRDPRHTPALESQRVAKENELRELKDLVKKLEDPSYTPPRYQSSIQPMGGRGGYQSSTRPIPIKTREEQLKEAKERIPQLEKDIANMYDVVKSMGMMIGCRTESSYGCVQSKRAHKMMRLYRRRKPIDKYPAAYFRVYQLNLDDPRFAEYLEENTMKTIRRDILPSEMDMFTGCRYMLVSQNRQYFMILSNSWLTIFWNYGNENLESLCRYNRNPTTAMAVRMIPFYGQSNTHLIIESGVLNIYSDIDEDEYNVYSREIALENSRSPYALVLQDDGTLILYDSKNQVASSADGFMTKNVYDPNGPDQNIDDYDAAADYRQRIINLIAYLRLYNLYREIVANQDDLPKDVAMYVLQDGIPPYNAEIDYKERLQNLVRYLIAKGYTHLVEKALEKPTENTSGNSNNSNTQMVPPATPSKDVWQKPSGVVDPNKEADVEECAGLEDEDLANCLEKNENDAVAKEQEMEKNAQTSEYALIDSDDPMAAAVSALDPGASSTDAVPATEFSEEEYQKAISICRVSATQGRYKKNQDLYCRVIALKEYLRKRGYRVIHTNKQTTTNTSASNQGKVYGGYDMPDYNQPVDFASRLQATRSLFTKP